MSTLIAPRPEVPSFHSRPPSTTSSSSPRVAPIPIERPASTVTNSSSYRQSWGSDNNVPLNNGGSGYGHGGRQSRPRSISSSGSVTLREKDRDALLGRSVDDNNISVGGRGITKRPSYERSASTSSANGRRPLETSTAMNYSNESRGNVGGVGNVDGGAHLGGEGMRRSASDQELGGRPGSGRKTTENGSGRESPFQPYQQPQSHSQAPQLPPLPHQNSSSYFGQPTWNTSTGASPGSTPMYFPNMFSPNNMQLPPQIQNLNLQQQQAYVQAMTQHMMQTGQAAYVTAYQNAVMAQMQQMSQNGDARNADGALHGVGGSGVGAGMPSTFSAPNLAVPGEPTYKDQPRSVSGSTTGSNSSNGQGQGYHPYRRQTSSTGLSAQEKEKAKKDKEREVAEKEKESRKETSVAASTVSNRSYPDPKEMQRPRPVPTSDVTPVDSGRGASAVPQRRVAVPAVNKAASAEDFKRSVSQAAKVQPKPPVQAEYQPRPSQDSFSTSTPRRNMHKRQNSSTSSVGEVIKPTLLGGSVTSLGTVTGQDGNSGWRPSAISQSAKPAPTLVSPERAARSVSDSARKDPNQEKKSSGLRGKLRAFANNDKEDKAKSLPPLAIDRPGMTASTSAPTVLHQPNNSIASTSTTTRSSSPPATPPQGVPPNLGNRRPSNSSFAPSFVEPLDGARGKPKRSLFNMRNASTDNISISSTVSSASMMIRKMGAIGKLARRNR